MMKPALKILIGVVVLAGAAYGGSILMDKMAANKAAVPAQVSIPEIPASPQEAPGVQTAAPEPLVPPVIQPQPESTNSGMDALLKSGKK